MRALEKVNRYYRKFVLGEDVGPLHGGDEMGETREAMKYPQPALEAFPAGVRLDLRARLANEYLKTSNVVQEFAKVALDEPGILLAATGGPEKRVTTAIAAFALDLAEALMAEAEKRGLCAPMPDTAELDAATKKQAQRMGAFGALQQIGGQRALQAEAAGQVAVAPAGMRAGH